MRANDLRGSLFQRFTREIHLIRARKFVRRPLSQPDRFHDSLRQLRRDLLAQAARHLQMVLLAKFDFRGAPEHPLPLR